MRVGVLALQGAFIEHEQMLQHIGVEAFEIRQLKDFQQPIDRLIIPGGESTTLRKLLKDTGIFTPIRERILDGMPVFGTCAGMILLAQHIENETDTGLATMDITVRRNAYGRQLGSFYTESEFKGIDHPIPMTFIRAPYIQSVGEGVEVLATVDGNIVAARQGSQLVTSFHPELNDSEEIHRLFLCL